MSRLFIVLLVMALAVSVSGCQPLQAPGEHATVSGDFRSMSTDHWFTPREYFGEVSVSELDRISHDAKGFVSYHAYDSDLGTWNRLEADVESAYFDEQGDTVVLMARLNHKSGWGDGEVGDYACFWVRDTEDGDQFGIHYFSDFVSSDVQRMTWPADSLDAMVEALPIVMNSDPSLTIDIVHGDLEVLMPG